MDVLKIVSDEFYKNEYVFVYPHIYDLKCALNMFKNKTESIVKVNNQKLVTGSGTQYINLTYTPFPSVNNMIAAIKQKREEIYNSLY